MPATCAGLESAACPELDLAASAELGPAERAWLALAGCPWLALAARAELELAARAELELAARAELDLAACVKLDSVALDSLAEQNIKKMDNANLDCKLSFLDKHTIQTIINLIHQVAYAPTAAFSFSFLIPFFVEPHRFFPIAWTKTEHQKQKPIWTAYKVCYYTLASSLLYIK